MTKIGLLWQERLVLIHIQENIQVLNKEGV